MKIENYFKEINKIVEQDKRNSTILSITGIVSIIGVFVIQEILRRMNMQFNDWLLFIRGTFPNFLGAIGYCTIFFVYFRAYLIKKGKYNFYTALFGAFIFSFGGLCLWELCQLLPFFTFDIFDILMTFAGSVLSSILIIFLYRKQNTK